MAATDMQAIEELLEAMISVRSVPRLQNKGQLPLQVKPSPDYRRALRESLWTVS
jgi:hypothetical protein